MSLMQIVKKREKYIMKFQKELKKFLNIYNHLEEELLKELRAAEIYLGGVYITLKVILELQ